MPSPEDIHVDSLVRALESAQEAAASAAELKRAPELFRRAGASPVAAPDPVTTRLCTARVRGSPSLSANQRGSRPAWPPHFVRSPAVARRSGAYLGRRRARKAIRNRAEARIA